MTAAKGILHSEMPEQEQGLMKGFQLCVNLPASAKMSEPAYQEFSPKSTPLERRENGTEVRVIAGKTNEGTQGPVINTYTHPTYMDVSLPANMAFTQSLPTEHNAFVYVIDGALSISDGDEKPAVPSVTVLDEKSLGVLTKGEKLVVQATEQSARFISAARYCRDSEY